MVSFGFFLGGGVLLLETVILFIKKILVTNSLHFHSSEICLYFSSSVNNIIIIIIIKGVLDTSPIYGTGGGSLTATNNSWTPIGCPTVQFNSDTMYQEIVSDPIY